MNKTYLIALCSAAIILSGGCSQEMRNGMMMDMGNGPLRVQLPADDTPAYTGKLLEERLARLTGKSVAINDAEAQAYPFLKLVIDERLLDRLGQEGYRIATSRNHATITAADGQGLLYGSARFIEWIMAHTTEGLIDVGQVDIDFPVNKGQAGRFVHSMPVTMIEEKPFYSMRGVEITNLALGVADLIDTPKIPEKYNPYSGVQGGFKGSSALWKEWCDWAARHRMNFVTNWPYSAGTNWWELANDPKTADMSIFSPEEITRAAEVRENLLAYARSRGLTPYLMNYVPGAPTDTIKKSHPEIVGEKFNPNYPEPFKLSNPQTTEVFTAQVKAIFDTYPSLGGLHLRFWGESFLDPKEGKARMLDLTVAMMEAAKENAPAAAFVMSGFRRSGGTPQMATRFPSDTTLQCKWGIDWEPVPEPGVPFEQITAFKRPLMISQNLPGEEYHSIGGVQYRSLEQGVLKYARAREQVPNLVGFANVAAEADFDWITVTNYMAYAKLNWAPLEANTEKLVKNYLALTYGPQVVEPAYQAMDKTQEAMEPFVLGFANVCPYIDCFRTHNMFGLGKVTTLSGKELQAGHEEISRYAELTAEAYALLQNAEDKVQDSGRESYTDLMIQTQWFADFFASRKVMVEAFIARQNREYDMMVDKLQQLKKMDLAMVELGMSKPNISDDFEMEGMSQAIHLKDFVNRELAEIDKVIAPENVQRLKNTYEIVGNPSTLAVRGQAGDATPMTFTVPDQVGQYTSARLVVSIWDTEGMQPGDEGKLRFQGKEILLPPTGDSRAETYDYEVDIQQLQPGPFVVEFILAGKPGGTAGYDVKASKLILSR